MEDLESVLKRLAKLEELTKVLEAGAVAMFHCRSCGVVFHVTKASEPGWACPLCAGIERKENPVTIVGVGQDG